MTLRIVFNGAGSVEFTSELLADLLGFDELADLTIALHDVSEERLVVAEGIARGVARQMGKHPTIEAHLDRRAALEGADHVISMIRVGGHRGLSLDFDIPRRYGVRQAMGDTLGIGAIFRALCTIPSLLALGSDMAELCPNAWLHNYTNPMATLCWAVYAGTPVERVIGLCMSPQATAEQLAQIVDVPFDEVAFVSGGINHLAFLLRFERDGHDLYPRLREVVEADPEGLGRRVRVEVFRRLGFFPTESSEHNADLVPWFLPHGGPMVDRFRIPLDDYLRRSEGNLDRFEEIRRRLQTGESLDIQGGPEYAPQIIHSIETGAQRTVYVNVRNGGLIENLPADCCVEVPALVDRAGVRPVRVGPLPRQLAAIDRTYASVCELTVQAALEGSREHVYHAAMLDPATAATIPLDRIQALCDDLIEAHADLLPVGIRA